MDIKLGGCRCSYKDCQNTTRVSENVHFFHFPVKNRQRCEAWIENAGKPGYFELEEAELKNKVICHHHFESKWFSHTQFKRLLPGAVPTLDRKPESGDVGPKICDAVYSSNQYKDVQVVAANDDNTVFYLDAENMFTESNKIESYVIKNGLLVPSSQVPKQLYSSKPKLGRANNGIHPYQQSKIASMEVSKQNEPPRKHFKTEASREQLLREVTIKKEVADPVDPLEIIASKPPPSQPRKDKVTAEYQDYDAIEVHLQPDGEQDTKSTLEKTYLRKIKQHSKEIATIKRLLAQKKIVAEKPDIKTAMSVLQERLPSTITSIISLLLGIKSDLAEEDVEFFTTLHRTSPEAYQILSDKYGWNLPSVDVVEADE